MVRSDGVPLTALHLHPVALSPIRCIGYINLSPWTVQFRVGGGVDGAFERR